MKKKHQEHKTRDIYPELTLDKFDSSETAKAWSKFLANRNGPSMPTIGVRKMIYKSWERSNKTGIRATQFAAPSLEKAKLNDKQRFYQSEMRRAAQLCLHNMSDMLAGTEAMLILTDKDGVILETVGDNSTLSKGGKINLDIGGVWRESASGTNGIGTALWMDKPVYVHGEEHFCEGMKAWSCAASPIHDPVDQSIIGVINLSGMTSIFQKHNAAFAASLARDIEVLLQQSMSQLNFKLLEWVVRRKPRQALTGTDKLAVINRFGRLVFDHFSHENTADPLAVERLGKPFLDLSGSISEEAIIATLPAKFICKDVQLIELDGLVKGASLIIEDNTANRRRKMPTKRIPLPAIEIGNTGLKIVGRSEAILAALETANSLLDSNAPTLIQGQTGVGKQLFARLIHARNDPSRGQHFTTINCAALTREMLGTEITSSVAVGTDSSAPVCNKEGDFLILDEIGEVPFELQPVLLSLLEQADTRTDGYSLQNSATRILSLTNRNLMDEVAAGNFRRDLFYRLGAVVLEIPPLRVRGDDILLIFEHYNRLLSAQSGRDPLVLSTDIEEALLAHDWPGNVRELCNTVSSLHCTVTARNAAISDLPFKQDRKETDVSRNQSGRATFPVAGSSSLKDSEYAVIENTLIAHNGNLSKAAVTLGISRPTLYRKMKLYKICIVDGNLRQL